MTSSTPLANDIIRGAEAIAAELLGNAKRRRQIYYLVEKHGLPVFRLGAILCARRSTLAAWITEQESK